MATEIFREFVLSKGNYYSQIKKFREIVTLSTDELSNHLLNNYSMLELTNLLVQYIKEENSDKKIPKIRITQEQLEEYFTFGRDMVEITSFKRKYKEQE